MHQGNTLQLLAAMVRSKTIQLLTAADDAALLWTPPATQNHLIWHCGHCLWVQDALCIEPVTGRSELPQGWA